MKKLGPMAREVFFSACWMLFLAKVAVSDIDILVIRRIAPSMEPYIRYNVVIVLLLIAILWSISGNKKFWANVLYMVTYPLVIIFWKLPYLAYSQGKWFLVVAYANTLVNFFKRFKRNVLGASLYGLGALLILVGNYAPTYYAGVAFVLVVLFWHYYERFRDAFRPATLLAIDNASVEKVLQSDQFQRLVRPKPTVPTSIAVELLDTPHSVDSASNSEKEKQQRLSTIVIMIQLLRHVNFFLMKLQETQTFVIFIFFGLLDTLFFTVLTLGFANFGLYRAVPHMFVLSESASYYRFVYYSFMSMIGNVVDPIRPASDFGRLTFMLQAGLGIVLLGLFVSLLANLWSERYRSGIRKVVVSLNTHREQAEENLRSEYSLTFVDASTSVINANSALRVLFPRDDS